MRPFCLSSLAPPAIFYWSSIGIKTPYRGPRTAEATRLVSAPAYMIGMAPARSKKPKLYRKPSPPVASLEPYIGLAYAQQRQTGMINKFYRKTKATIAFSLTLSATELVAILEARIIKER